MTTAPRRAPLAGAFRCPGGAAYLVRPAPRGVVNRLSTAGPAPNLTLTMTFHVRDYAPSDEPSWLRCRVLSFLGSSYHDDVKTARTVFDGESLQLVAVRPRPEGMTTPGPDEVVGILDVELWSEEGEPVATIDTVAVHPDHQGRRVATMLLEQVLPVLRGRGVRWLDAWTREDPEACGWYAGSGFVVDQGYLHVYKDDASGDPDEGYAAPHGLGAPVKAFYHGPDEDPAVWRARFARVHRCSRYLLRLERPDVQPA